MFRSHSFSLSTADGARGAVEAECRALAQQSDGKVEIPDAFILCAGSAFPRFWVEAADEQLVQGMEQAYWVQAWTAHVSVHITFTFMAVIN